MPRNDEGCEDQFLQPGRAAGQQRRKVIEEKEKNAAHLHVLLNCEEVEPYQE